MYLALKVDEEFRVRITYTIRYGTASHIVTSMDHLLAPVFARTNQSGCQDRSTITISIVPPTMRHHFTCALVSICNILCLHVAQTYWFSLVSYAEWVQSNGTGE